MSRLRQEEGTGLVLVLVVSLVLSVLVTAAMASATSTMGQSRDDQDRQAALAAAEAGIDDYLYRLNRDEAYWRYNAGNLPPQENPALRAVTATTGWARVPGSINESEYHYDVDAAQLPVNGNVILRSTGRVRDETRTIQVSVAKSSILEYLYYTDYETLDPAAYGPACCYDSNPANSGGPPGTPPTGNGSWSVTEDNYRTWAAVNCVTHRHPPTTTRSGWCREISFASGDVIQGKFHTNDSFRLQDNATAQWTRSTTTSWQDPAGRFWIGTANPSFPPGSPAYAPSITIPPSNLQLKSEATGPGGSGCLYRGPTEIVLLADGTMNVRSPLTNRADTRLNPGCIGGSSGSTAFTNHPLPPNGVAYVETAPSGTCSGSNALGYPVSGDITPYACGSGDLFVRGTLQGQLTITAENNIIINGDLRYRDRASADLLGLIANNFVEIYHPVNSSGQNIDARPSPTGTQSVSSELYDATVEAAVLSVAHSIRVQNYSRGARRGDLQVFGAIAQRFRGPVGFGGSTPAGYLKDYTYDERLAYLSPPRFIEPLESYWEKKRAAEITPLY